MSGVPGEELRSAAPPLAAPRHFLASAWRDLRRCRPLALAIARRDLRVQYRRPVAAVLAVLLPPLAMTAIGVGFRAAGVITLPAGEVPYPLFVLAGLVLWFGFVEALHAPLFALLAERALLTRSTAPPEAVVLGSLATVLANLALRLAFLGVVAALWAGAGPPAPGALLAAVVGALVLALLGAAVGMLLAPLNLVYRDAARLLMVVTTVWLFLSPVYFAVPDGGVVAGAMALNPVTPLLSASRAALLAGGPMVPPAQTAAALATTLGLAALAWPWLRITLPVALERAGD